MEMPKQEEQKDVTDEKEKIKTTTVDVKIVVASKNKKVFSGKSAVKTEWHHKTVVMYM